MHAVPAGPELVCGLSRKQRVRVRPRSLQHVHRRCVHERHEAPRWAEVGGSGRAHGDGSHAASAHVASRFGPSPRAVVVAGYYDGLPVAYNVKYAGPVRTGTVLSVSLERDCYVRSVDDPSGISVGNVMVDPITLDQLCCVGRGRANVDGCNFGCGNIYVDSTSYWLSDNAVHGALCFVNCYWF